MRKALFACSWVTSSAYCLLCIVSLSVEVESPHGLFIPCLWPAQVAGDDEDLLLVESDEEGLAAEADALAARRTFALQHDSLFGLDSQSQHPAPLPIPAESAPAQVDYTLMI